MQSTVLTTVALTGFTVAFFHAAIPTHWLPFIVVGKAQGWSRRRTLAQRLVQRADHALMPGDTGFLQVDRQIARHARLLPVDRFANATATDANATMDANGADAKHDHVVLTLDDARVLTSRNVLDVSSGGLLGALAPATGSASR